MGIIIIILWIIGVALFALFGAFYVRKYNSPDALIGIYVAVVVISNITAYKIASYNFYYFSLIADSATLVFPVTFLLTDVVNERFGRKETQKMILIAFISQVATAFFIWLSISLDPSSTWSDSTSFNKVLGFAPRIMFASWVAFLISENADAYIFAWFKKATGGRYLWMRNALSSVPSMALDTAIFTTIAFYGLQPLVPLILGVLLIKWLVAIVDIPFFYMSRAIMYPKKKNHDTPLVNSPGSS